MPAERVPLSPALKPAYDRLVTPRDHLGLLIEPPPADLRATWPHAAGAADAPLLDSTLAALRDSLRARLGLAGPVFLTGHQVEFFHAGVFAKTIAAHALCQRHGGAAVFLAVDSDLPKTAALAVPQITPGGVRRIEIEIPGCDVRRPSESQPPVPREHWLQFFARAASIYELHDRSLLGTFARAWLAGGGPNLEYCASMAAARRATEEALGLGGVRELRISDVCRTPEFRAFLAHLLLHADEVARTYNAAQAAYRTRHKVRTVGRPVPPLALEGERVELPLWIWRLAPSNADSSDEAGKRRRLWTSRTPDRVQIFADAELVAELPIAALAEVRRHEQPWLLERDGWQIRPRALALSGFARLLLADLFIHGIGGAKYDEVTDDWLTALFNASPHGLSCVTATLRLPLPHSGVRPADIAALRHTCRDVRWNPQRHLPNLPPELGRTRTELVRRSEDLRAHDPRDRASRRAVFQELRRVTAQMLEVDPWRAAQCDERAETLADQVRRDRVALDREYFFALHPRTELERLVYAIRHAFT